MLLEGLSKETTVFQTEVAALHLCAGKVRQTRQKLRTGQSKASVGLRTCFKQTGFDPSTDKTSRFQIVGLENPHLQGLIEIIKKTNLKLILYDFKETIIDLILIAVVQAIRSAPLHTYLSTIKMV